MNAYEVLNSPIVVALISVAATALVTIAVAALRMVIQMTQLKTEMSALRADIAELKTDADVMRWSNYGRAVQAFQGLPPHTGVMP